MRRIKHLFNNATLFCLVSIAVFFAFHFPAGAQEGTSEQEGSTLKTAVVLKDLQSFTDIDVQEQKYLQAIFGTRGEDWILYEQDSFEQDGRHYDKMTVKLTSSGGLKTVYFDITEPFIKFNLPMED